MAALSSTFNATQENSLVLKAYVPASEDIGKVVAQTEELYKLFERVPIPFKPGRDRLKDITPFAYNQVKLLDGTETNGSWISCSDSDKPGKYIAISAPMPEYFPIFMRMLCEKKVAVILNLTGFVEYGHRKADPYLPARQGEKIIKEKNYTVTCEKQYPNYKLSEEWALEQRDFSLEVNGVPHIHKFTQFHLPDWKDFTPGTVDGLFYLVKRLYDYRTANGISGPTLVHCSAGVGRTGTYINSAEVYDRVRRNAFVSIFDIAVHTRSQRIFLGGGDQQLQRVHQICDLAKAERAGDVQSLMTRMLLSERPPVKISVHQNIGYNNFLAIRGEKGGLNWDKGMRLKSIGPETWEIELRYAPNCQYKLLLNDAQWEKGNNHNLDKKSNTITSLDF